MPDPSEKKTAAAWGGLSVAVAGLCGCGLLSAWLGSCGRGHRSPACTAGAGGFCADPIELVASIFRSFAGPTAFVAAIFGVLVVALVVYLASGQRKPPAELDGWQALAGPFRDGTPSSWLEFLRRNGRSPADWAAGLRREIVVPSTPQVPRPWLFEVLEYPQALTGDRVAAAVALVADLDEETRRRIEAVARAAEDATLQVALGQVARGDAVKALAVVQAAEDRSVGKWARSGWD